MDRYQVNLKGVVSWSFEFENREWFAGFRELATHGIDKPVLNIFRMFSVMKGNRIQVKGDNEFNATDIITNGVREKNDINAIASKNKNSVCIMIWNYNDNDVEGPSSDVELTVIGMSTDKVLVHHYRVDRQFSNSFEKWKSMGKPQQVADEQYHELERSGHLKSYAPQAWKKTTNGELILKFNLPRQGVSLIRITW
jgi:xylan 1,4-beta-xylosidase